MKKINVLMGSLLLASAFMSFGCDDSIGSGELDTNLHFTCVNPANCSVVMNTNSVATLTLQLGDADGTLASGMNVSMTPNSSLVSLVQGQNYTTAQDGTISMILQSGATGGAGTVTAKLVSTDYVAQDANINVFVNENGATLSCLDPANCLIAMAPNSTANLSILATAADGSILSDTPLSFSPNSSLISVNNAQASTNVAGVASVVVSSGAMEGSSAVTVGIASGLASNLLNVAVVVSNSYGSIMNLECVDPENCQLDMDTNSTAKVTIHAKDGNNGNISGASLLLSQSPQLVSLPATSVTTDVNGNAIIVVTSDSQEGSTTINVVPQASNFSSVALPIRVKVTEPLPTYEVDFSYKGEQKVDSLDVLAFKNKKCADIIDHEFFVDELEGISGEDISDSLPSIDDTFAFTPEAINTTYAVIGLGKDAQGAYFAYGCNDTLTVDAPVMMVKLQDAKPDITEFAGEYDLVSSFDMTSILNKYDCGQASCKPTFAQMKPGDWVTFILDFFSDPENSVVDLVVDQLVPLIFNNEKLLGWLQDMLGEQMGAVLNETIVKMLVEAVRPTIVATLQTFTNQLPWWNDMKSISTIVDKFVTEFTLAGKLNIPDNPDENGDILSNTHTYTEVLYTLDQYGCPLYEKDGLCVQPLGAEAIKGTWNGNIGMCDGKMATCLDIDKHPMTIAYANVLYKFVTETIFPLVFKGQNINSFGTLVENLALQALVDKWNKDHPDNAINTTGCAGFADWTIKQTAGKDFFGKDLSELLSSIGGSTLIATGCTAGVKALDKLIEKQLGKLTASAEKVNFSSAQCQLNINESLRICSNIGTPKAKCIWNIAVDGNDKFKIKGSFYSTHILH